MSVPKPFDPLAGGSSATPVLGSAFAAPSPPSMVQLVQGALPSPGTQPPPIPSPPPTITAAQIHKKLDAIVVAGGAPDLTSVTKSAPTEERALDAVKDVVAMMQGTPPSHPHASVIVNGKKYLVEMRKSGSETKLRIIGPDASRKETVKEVLDALEAAANVPEEISGKLDEFKAKADTGKIKIVSPEEQKRALEIAESLLLSPAACDFDPTDPEGSARWTASVKRAVSDLKTQTVVQREVFLNRKTTPPVPGAVVTSPNPFDDEHLCNCFRVRLRAGYVDLLEKEVIKAYLAKQPGTTEQGLQQGVDRTFDTPQVKETLVHAYDTTFSDCADPQERAIKSFAYAFVLKDPTKTDDDGKKSAEEQWRRLSGAPPAPVAHRAHAHHTHAPATAGAPAKISGRTRTALQEDLVPSRGVSWLFQPPLPTTAPKDFLDKVTADLPQWGAVAGAGKEANAKIACWAYHACKQAYEQLHISGFDDGRAQQAAVRLLQQLQAGGGALTEETARNIILDWANGLAMHNPAFGGLHPTTVGNWIIGHLLPSAVQAAPAAAPAAAAAAPVVQQAPDPSLVANFANACGKGASWFNPSLHTQELRPFNTEMATLVGQNVARFSKGGPASAQIFYWAYCACEHACQSCGILSNSVFLEAAANDLCQQIKDKATPLSNSKDLLRITQEWATHLSEGFEDAEKQAAATVGQWLLGGLIPKTVGEAPQFPVAAAAAPASAAAHPPPCPCCSPSA